MTVSTIRNTVLSLSLATLGGCAVFSQGNGIEGDWVDENRTVVVTFDGDNEVVVTPTTAAPFDIGNQLIGEYSFDTRGNGYLYLPGRTDGKLVEKTYPFSRVSKKELRFSSEDNKWDRLKRR